jgi:hypothetical protein
MMLQQECRKREPNSDILQEKMEKTFRQRRAFVMKHSVQDVLDEYPALKRESLVSRRAVCFLLVLTFIRVFLSLL